MAGRWPLHPPPYPDEALTSWLSRLAAIYGRDPIDFLGYEFNYLTDREQFEFLDLKPPDSLLEGLSERTGVEISQVRSLTAQSYTPLLIESLTPLPEYYADYVYQFNLLFSKSKPMKQKVKDWVPWFNRKRFLTIKGCKACINEDIPYLRLYWRFPWMMSCPKHGILLKNFRFFTTTLGWKIQVVWSDDKELSQETPDTLLRMDAITLKAVNDGYKRSTCR